MPGLLVNSANSVDKPFFLAGLNFLDIFDHVVITEIAKVRNSIEDPEGRSIRPGQEVTISNFE